MAIVLGGNCPGVIALGGDFPGGGGGIVQGAVVQGASVREALARNMPSGFYSHSVNV